MQYNIKLVFPWYNKSNSIHYFPTNVTKTRNVIWGRTFRQQSDNNGIHRGISDFQIYNKPHELSGMLSACSPHFKWYIQLKIDHQNQPLVIVVIVSVSRIWKAIQPSSPNRSKRSGLFHESHMNLRKIINQLSTLIMDTRELISREVKSWNVLSVQDTRRTKNKNDNAAFEPVTSKPKSKFFLKF